LTIKKNINFLYYHYIFEEEVERILDDNVERLLESMEETIIHLHDEGAEWLAELVQEAFDFIEERLQEEVI